MVHCELTWQKLHRTQHSTTEFPALTQNLMPAKIMPDSPVESIVNACTTLTQGGVIIYPTDTVYGLGADATNAAAVAQVRTVKGRAADTPILAMVRDIAMLREYAHLTPLAEHLAATFLPGPLTLVLTPHSDALKPIAAHDGSVGFRIPDHPVCRDLSSAFPTPITSTSLNRSGFPQPRTLSAMLEQVGEQAALVNTVIDHGTLPESLPSTIVDARDDVPHVVREGAIAAADIIHTCSG